MNADAAGPWSPLSWTAASGRAVQDVFARRIDPVEHEREPRDEQQVAIAPEDPRTAFPRQQCQTAPGPVRVRAPSPRVPGTDKRRSTHTVPTLRDPTRITAASIMSACGPLTDEGLRAIRAPTTAPSELPMPSTANTREPFSGV